MTWLEDLTLRPAHPLEVQSFDESLLDAVLYSLPNLRALRLSSWGLQAMPESVTSMKKLEVRRQSLCVCSVQCPGQTVDVVWVMGSIS